jgi:hypothetical protein
MYSQYFPEGSDDLMGSRCLTIEATTIALSGHFLPLSFSPCYSVRPLALAAPPVHVFSIFFLKDRMAQLWVKRMLLR